MSTLLQVCTSPDCLYSETCLCRPVPSVPFTAVQVILIAKLRKSPDTKEIELCAVTCADVQFRMRSESVESDIRYITLLIYKDLKNSN